MQRKKAISYAILLFAIGIVIFFVYPYARSYSARFLFEKGNGYFAGNPRASERLYKTALFIDSNFPGPNYQLARIEFLRGRFFKSLDYINKEINLHPDFKRSYYVRGLINGYAGNLTDAENDFKEFLKWDSRSWAAHNDLAWIYFAEGKYDDSFRVAREGLKFYPGNPWLLNSMGVSLLNKEKIDEAKEVLAKAVEQSEKLTVKDWIKAYPGNNPAISEKGLNSLVSNIKANYGLALRLFYDRQTGEGF